MSTARVWVKQASIRMYDGQPLDPGEIFNLRNGLHDQKLLEHHYVEEVGKDSESGIADCIGCSRSFINAHYRDAHAQRARHDPLEVDRPQLKGLASQIDPGASGPERELEPAGAPGPQKAEEVGVAVDRGSRKIGSGGGSRADEVFRL